MSTFGAVELGVSALQASGTIAVLVYLAVSWLKESPIASELDSRAMMRSMSWPADNANEA